MEASSHRNPDRRTYRLGFRRLIAKIAGFSILAATCPELRADIHSRSLHIPQAVAASWSRAIPPRQNWARADCVTGQSLRRSLQRCKKSSAALGGRLWIPEVVCGDGKWTVTTAKMSRSDQVNSWDDRVQPPLSTLTPTRES